MNILIAGGTGFLGRALNTFFEKQGHNVTVLTRNPIKTNEIFWDAKAYGAWVKELESTDVLINLCGKSVDCRYTEENKKEILSSRIDSTQVLINAIQQTAHPPLLLINASSATIYVHAEETPQTERNGIIGDDFSMNVCKKWEEVFFKTELTHTRQVSIRTSIVLSNSGGAFPKLKTITKLGLGGRQGRGTQKVSWIHIEDFCRAVHFIIEQRQIEGAINITSPNPLSNASFMKTLRQKLKALFGLPTPIFLLELGSWFIRTETELLLKSRWVLPERLIKNGFEFKYGKLSTALKQLCY